MAANARWHGKAKVTPKALPRPPAGWVLACMGRILDDYQDRAGYAGTYGKLAEVVAWVKEQRTADE